MMRVRVVILLSLFFTGCFSKGIQENNTSENNSTDNNTSVKKLSPAIVIEAKKHLSKPYEIGQTGPKSFDCSGFVYAMHKKLGKAVPRTSLAQSKIKGKKLSKSELKEGDLVFFDTSLKGKVNHSGIYLGEGKFIHATSGKAYSVTISDINAWYKDKFRWGKRKR